MPGINVVIPTQWKSKLALIRSVFDGTGSVNVRLKANLSVPDGTPLHIAATGICAEISATGPLVPNALSFGNLVGGATDGAVLDDVQPIAIGDRLRGILTEAVPADWYGKAVGFVKGAGAAGYTIATSAFITGSNTFKIVDLRGAAIGDTGKQVEIERAS